MGKKEKMLKAFVEKIEKFENFVGDEWSSETTYPQVINIY